MLEHKTIKWILKILAIALIIYVIFLLMNEDDHSVIPAKQEYVSTAIDSAVPVFHITPDAEVDDTLLVVDMPNVVAVIDSDSTKHYDLYRHQQAIVTIDMEEHKEHIFFTWDDLVSYYYVVLDFIQALIHKI